MRPASRQPDDVPVAPPAWAAAGCGAGSRSVGRPGLVVVAGGAGGGRVGSGGHAARSTRRRSGCGHAVAPGAVGLEPMVVAAERGEVRRRGWPGLRSALRGGVVVELDDVIDVASARGRECTTGTRTVRSRKSDLLADPVGDLVRRGGQLGAEVDDGLDGDWWCGNRRTSPGPGRAGRGADPAPCDRSDRSTVCYWSGSWSRRSGCGGRPRRAAGSPSSARASP